MTLLFTGSIRIVPALTSVVCDALQNDSGDVTPKEFANALERFGVILNDKDTKQFFSTFDHDGSGAISYDEFIEAVYGEE